MSKRVALSVRTLLALLLFYSGIVYAPTLSAINTVAAPPVSAPAPIQPALPTPASTTATQTLWDWQNQQWPPPADYAMTYAAALGRLVLVGATRANTKQSTTWEYSGTTWIPVRTPTNPPTRELHALAYDDNRKAVVLFGATDTNNYATWEYDGMQWQITTSVPEPRDQHTLAYDERRQKTVLFGGANRAGLPFNDTWEYDGATWVQVFPPTSPPARAYHVLAYDTVRQRTVLFGGTYLTDTWEYDGTTWTQILTPVSPPSYRGSTMAYDTARQRMVLFGGNYRNETWEYDGTTWAPIPTASAPPGRSDAALAYDATRQRMVLFGGLSDVQRALDDTWEYDGVHWAQIPATVSTSVGMHGRYDHTMVYDPLRGRVILFSGRYTDATYDFSLNETWEYDGATWAQIASGDARYGHAMAYDAARGRIVVFGGDNKYFGLHNDTREYDYTAWRSIGTPPPRTNTALVYDAATGYTLLFGGAGATGSLSDTWRYASTAWQPITTTVAPPARTAHALVYDASRGKVVLFGGEDIAYNDLNDTWEYDHTGWHQITTPHVPAARRGHALAYDTTRNRVVLFGGYDRPTGVLSDTWEFDGTDWISVTTAIAPAARFGHTLAYDPQLGATVLFGGYPTDPPNTTNSFNDMWAYDGTSWQRRSPDAAPRALAPPGRDSHAMAYDTLRQRTVLFGGKNWAGLNGSAQALNDTWEYDGATWQPRSLALAPPMRYGHAMVYDATRQKIILFGGATIMGVTLGDTWEYDGSTWTQVTTAQAPAARYGHAMAYDPVRQRVVLFGGASPNVSLSDTWEYDGADWVQVYPTGAIPNRQNHAMVYDAGRGKVVLFGGYTTYGYHSLSDTWEYDGTTWQLSSTPIMPPARFSHSMVYDSLRGKMILFGGSGMQVNDANTWEFDASGWQQRVTPNAPPSTSRVSGAAVYATAQQQLLFFGGNDQSVWIYRATALFTATATSEPTPDGGDLRYTLAFSSTDTTYIVTMTNSLPADLRFASATPSLNGAPTQFSLRVTPAQIGQVALLFHVAPDVPNGTLLTLSSVAAFDQLTTQIAVTSTALMPLPSAILAATVFPPNYVAAGGVLDYRIAYQNSQGGAAHVQLTAPIPPNTFPVSAEQGGRLVGNQVVWDLGQLTRNAAGVVEFRVRVDPAAPPQTPITETLTLNTDQIAPLQTMAERITVLPTLGQLVLDVAVDRTQPITVGETVVYTLTLANMQSLALDGITVTLDLPAGLGLAQALDEPPPLVRSGTLAGLGQRLVWANMVLSPANQLTLRFIAQANAPIEPLAVNATVHTSQTVFPASVTPCAATAGWYPAQPTANAATFAVGPFDDRLLTIGGGNGTLWSSGDRGGTWTTVAPSYTASNRTLAINPRNHYTRYTGVYGKGIATSLDGGLAWGSPAAVSGNKLTTLVVADSAAQTIYAGTYGGGLFTRAISDTYWVQHSLDVGPAAQAILALASASGDPRYVYAGTDGAGVYRSTDAGATWGAASVGLTDQHIYALALDPFDPQLAYAATLDGVFMTQNGGTAWFAAGGALPSIAKTLHVDPQFPSWLYAATQTDGVFMSHDRGATWQALPLDGFGGLSINALALGAPSYHCRTLYAATSWGVWAYNLYADALPTPPNVRLLTGNVALEARTDNSGTLVTVGTLQATTDVVGSYSFTGLPMGNYALHIVHEGYLAVTTPVTVGVTTTHVVDVTLRAGDVNGDDQIDILDLIATANGDPRADFNADGVVDIFDLVLVVRNITQAGGARLEGFTTPVSLFLGGEATQKEGN